MKRVLLVYLNPVDWASIAAPPYGLEILASSVSDLPIQVTIENPFIYDDPVGYIQRYLSKNTFDIIGLSIRNLDNMAHVWEGLEAGLQDINSRCFIDDIIPVVDAINANSDAFKLCGGAAFSVAPCALLKRLKIPYGIQGPGEESFRKIVMGMLSGEEIGSYVETQIDQLPGMVRVDWDKQDIQLSTYLQPRITNRYPVYKGWTGSVPVRVSYGCAGTCSYCVERACKSGVTFRSADDIVREIEEVGVENQNIWLVCSELNMPDEHFAQELCSTISSRSIHNRLLSYFVPRNFTPALYEKLIGAGFTNHSICFGMTHISDNILIGNGIPYRKKDIVETMEALRFCKADGVSLGIILGLKGENKDTIEELAEWIIETSEFFGDGFRCFVNSGVRVYPNTPMEGWIKSDGNTPGVYGQSPPYDLIRPLVYSAFLPPKEMLEAFLKKTRKAKGMVVSYNKGSPMMLDRQDVLINFQKAMMHRTMNDCEAAMSYLDKALNAAVLQENKRSITIEILKLKQYAKKHERLL